MPAKIDVAVAEAAAIIDREIELQKPKPIYTEQPVNDELQTGDSRDLGGEMRIQSPVKPAFDQWAALGRMVSFWCFWCRMVGPAVFQHSGPDPPT